MNSKNQVSSPSRTYVAVCNKPNFDGHYFRKFDLPESVLNGMQLNDGTYMEGSHSFILRNNTEDASWYFLSFLNRVACIDCVITWEDYNSLENQDELNAKIEEEWAKTGS